ncbi:hypothetical protein QN360_14475 [Glaciimonas sp. CA11.2]|uniref:hypothetical protein n=1 Tax=unclassified Glaciimonas TaxID=2644401 RepID=UPI002AB59ED3|nr:MULTISPECIES: hypothetical protein [unclassified Glaciimonas]MDY7549057.1 hypothetical protein [Glaciimonas sp. CA11.2]MEB0013150.1 hypothetical protein [Glaciimonas sp. Cout2]MEB0081967.1 hypothetical protein [Glaciimonas sp. Gout2]MEB0164107.1 hypothetical protein [Glaciimonas sp. CA11.2]
MQHTSGIAFSAILASGLFAAITLSGCTVVSVATTVVGATVAVGSAAVSVASTVVSGTVKAGGAVVGAVVD